MREVFVPSSSPFLPELLVSSPPGANRSGTSRGVGTWAEREVDPSGILRRDVREV